MDKSTLQLVNEICQRLFHGKVASVSSTTRQFMGDNETDVELTLPDGAVFTATACNKKDAKQLAACDAYTYLEDRYHI